MKSLIPAAAALHNKPLRVSTTRVPADLPRPRVPVSSAPGQPFFGKGPVGMRKTELRPKERPKEKPRVLLADDDKHIRIIFRLCLERLGCQVFEAEDGASAWQNIKGGNPDLIVLDIKMPGLHGLEVLQHMSARGMRTPVILCSAYDQLLKDHAASAHPRIRYLAKPAGIKDLERMVKELLR